MADTTRRFLMALATAISLLPVLAKGDSSPTIVRIGALVPPVLISPEEGMGKV